jgi:hypothetical protein
LLFHNLEKDHTVPFAIADASLKREERNEGVTGVVAFPDPGHALTIYSGWQDIADTARELSSASRR